MVHGVVPLLVFFLAAAGLAQTSDSKNSLLKLSGAIRQLTSQVSPAVVEIVVSGYTATNDGAGQTSNQVSRQRSTGSGVIVDPEGYIMTNAHVVEGAVRIKVLVPDGPPSNGNGIPKARTSRILGARILGIDSESDLALLKVDQRGLPVLRFADSDKIQQGDLVFAIGSPLGLRNSASMGVVSAPGRAINAENPIPYIQTDAAINPGDSGGALVDTQGLLIGMNTLIVSQSGGNEGIGFAIPSNIVRNVYHQLRRAGHVSRGFIGTQVQDITPVLAKGLHLAVPNGVVVSDVDADSPAERAGLKRRDVILSFNDQAIETALQLRNEVNRRHGGEKIRLVVLRADEQVSLVVEVQEQAAPWDPLAALASPQTNLVPRLGILCVEIDEQLAPLIQGLRRKYGVIVVAKSPDGQAQFIDLQPGDVIHTVNDLTIASLAALQHAVQEVKSGDAVVLQIERDQHFQYVAFEME